MMQTSSDIGLAVSLLKQTLPEMQKRNIATTPENYAVWYEYVSGRNAELVNEINLLDLNRSSFTSNVHRELYQKHIASQHEATVNQLSDSVKQVINEFLLRSRHEGEGLSVYSKALNDISSEVNTTQDIAELKLMIAQLIEHTKEREAATCAMQESLESMSNEMQRLKNEVARLSGETSVDPLTRISTRATFDEDLAMHISMSQSQDEALSLAILEVDQFDQFRDKFGDTIGDKVLKFISTLFKKHLKGNDLIARYDEYSFALLLPDTQLEGAITVAENLRQRLAKQTLSDSAEKLQLGTITVSCGVAELNKNNDIKSFNKRAEALLSAARFEGGNRVQS